MCGIVGIYSETHVASAIYDSLLMLQHRGQDAAGMVVCNEVGRLNSRKSMGYVRDAFQQSHMNKLLGNYGIGHVRYPTAGGAGKEFAQPMYVNSPYGISLAHNGNLTNALLLREILVKDGAIFRTTSDTETIVQLIARSKREKFVDKLIDALFQIQGGYSLVLMTNKKLIGVRDPFGIRPLVVGKIKNSFIFAYPGAF